MTSNDATTTGVPDALQESFRAPQRRGNTILDINPISVIVTVVSTLAVAIAFYEWRPSWIIIGVYLLTAMAANRLRSFFAAFWKLAVLIGAFFFALRALFLQGEHVVKEIGPLKITREGIDAGLNMASVMIAVSAAVVLIIVLIDPELFTVALENLGFPPSVSFVILSTFQTLKDLSSEVTKILDSQRARGIETEGNMLIRTKAFLPTLGPLFLSAIISAEEKAIAMDARGFSSGAKRVHLRFLRTTPVSEKAALLLVNMAAIVLVVVGIVTR